jgi:hypothetical protein
VIKDELTTDRKRGVRKNISRKKDEVHRKKRETEIRGDQSTGQYERKIFCTSSSLRPE